MSNPFTPPSSRVADGAKEKGSPVKAVVFGFLVDVGGSIAVGMLLAVAYGVSEARSGATPDQIAASLQNLPVGSWLSIVGMVIGGLFSVLGGYVCARVAKHSEFGLGAILAALSISFGAWAGAGEYSLVLHLVLSVATFLAVMFGVRMGAARNAA
jgi:hypothetical protein